MARAETVPHLVIGAQQVPKFGSSRPSEIHNVVIALAVIRLPAANTDFLVSFNAPHTSTARMVIPQSHDIVREKILQVLAGLRIIDWGLFA